MRFLLTTAVALSAIIANAQTTYDARIEDYKGLKYPCDGSVIPVLQIKNIGSATMSTCVVETWKNGAIDNTFNWILGVPAATGQLRQPSFPPIAVAPGDEIELRIISVNTNPDEDATGNIRTETMEAAPMLAPAYTMNVEVKTDDFPSETTWAIRNDLGAVVASGGPYFLPNATELHDVVLSASDCYTFEVSDAGGDGITFGNRTPGYVRVSSLGTTLIDIDGGDFTDHAEEGLRSGASACVLTQLTTSATPEISCGADVWMGGGSTLYATDVPTANKYQWRFTRGTYVRTIAKPTSALPITQWTTLPLKAGRIYNVDVRCSYDNGATWCPYGPVCTVRTRNGVQPAFRSLDAVVEEPAVDGLMLYPVPNDGNSVSIRFDANMAAMGVAQLTVLDMSGRSVDAQPLTIVEGEQNLPVNFSSALPAGFYLVQMNVHGVLLTERMVVR
ncbi:MAG: T9SS type A sorting domain-containing protein [Flavobacteriales bacterium]